MDSASQDLETFKRLHQEGAREAAEELSDNMAAILTRIRAQSSAKATSSNGAYDRVLSQLDKLSESWPRLEQEKVALRHEALWKKLVEACYNQELELLREQGHTENAAKNLVRIEKAWWDRVVSRFETGTLAPEFEKSVEVVVVQREAGFRIHEEIVARLWQHPKFTGDLGRVRSSSPSPRDKFKNTLGKVEDIELEYGFHEWEEIPSYDEIDEETARALACIMTSLDMELALEPRGGSCNEFLDAEEPTPGENLRWLVEAKQGQHFWHLLNTAVKLGRTLNQYDMFRESDIKKAIRTMLIASLGRKASAPGRAVERIITAARKDGLGTITATTLLGWLKGDRDWLSDGKPLIVNHRLWGEELADLTWDKFENLVKSAGRRVDRK